MVFPAPTGVTEPPLTVATFGLLDFHVIAVSVVTSEVVPLAFKAISFRGSTSPPTIKIAGFVD
jgi:hypothetical protein